MIIYKTINLINSKIYVGQDKYNNPNYFGSGWNLTKAIKKYGKHNFKKEVLEVCESKEDLDNRERFWIKELHAQDRKIGYNIVDGGQGGNLGEHANTKKKITLKLFFEKNPNARKGKNNPRYDSTIHHFYNIETEEEYSGTKYEMGIKIGSTSSHINAIVTETRRTHKNWVLMKYKEIYTKDFLLEERRRIGREKRKNTLIKNGYYSK